MNLDITVLAKNWTIDTLYGAPEVQQLADTLGIPALVSRLLLQRGLTTSEAVREFLRPHTTTLSDPFAYGGMETAVCRIQQAISRNEKIMISGDYDVDGVTATAVLKEALDNCGAVCETYIPDRFQDGYGLSPNSIDYAREIGAGLIVTVDCGTNDTNTIEDARISGIDCIVCDHHHPDPPLPPAVAILNPKIAGQAAPFTDFSAVGVAFKLAQALYSRLRGAIECADSLLDLVAIGTVADIVPLCGENRSLVSRGLERINAGPRPGVQALLESAGFNPPRRIGTTQILFTLAPRINAAGRMEHADPAVALLATTDINIARRLAAQLEDANLQRRQMEETIMVEAEAQLASTSNLEDDCAIVLAGEGWHEGVIGIVASRLMNRFYRPVVMMAVRDGVGRGSCRSVPEFNLVEGLTVCERYLLRYGGHPMAAGLTIDRNEIGNFRKAFLAVARERLCNIPRKPSLKIDGWVKFEDIDDRTVQLLKMFEPFGPLNPRPVFAAEAIQVVGSPQIVGTSHLKFKARQHGQILDAIGFGMGDALTMLPVPPETMQMAFHIDENTWNGRTITQLQIKDLRHRDVT